LQEATKEGCRKCDLLCIETCDEEEKEVAVSLGAGSSIFCLFQGECFSKNQMQEQEDCEENQCEWQGLN
jgi:hypothetical protein